MSMWEFTPRRLFTVQQYFAEGRTRGELRWQEDRDLVVQVIRGVYGDGPEEPSEFDKALATMIRNETPAWGLVAARFHRLDAVSDLDPPIPHRHRAPHLGGEPVVIDGVLCTSALQTMVDLATASSWPESTCLGQTSAPSRNSTGKATRVSRCTTQVASPPWSRRRVGYAAG